MNPCLPPALHRQKGCTHLDDGACFRTLTVWTWPDEVEVGWLQTLFREPVDVTLIYDAIPNDVAAQRIGKQHEHHKETLLSTKQRDRLKTHELVDVEQTAADSLEVVRALRRNQTKLFRIGFHVRIHAASHEEGDRLESRVVRICRGKTMEVKPERVRLEEAYFQALPLGLDLLGTGQTLPLQYAATTFPFAAGGGTTTREGVLYGVLIDEDAGRTVRVPVPVIVDRWPADARDVVNPHGIYIGESGFGKSFCLGLEAMRQSTRSEVLIVDLQHEYLGVVAALGGWIVTDPDDASQYPPEGMSGPGVVICFAIDPTLPAVRKHDLMRRVFQALWTRCVRDRTVRKWVAIDEAWEWLSVDPELAYNIWRMAKEGRKYGVALNTATQNPADIAKGDRAGGGESVLGNARTKMLFGGEHKSLRAVAEIFDLSEGEIAFLETAQQGDALLIHGRHRTGIHVVASPRELAIVQASLKAKDAAA